VDEIVAVSPELVEVLANVDAVATTNTTVLVCGETGVGKEIVARALHARSRRTAAPLVKIDCASLPRELFEREFFGYRAGAWPGIAEERIGRFELADRGTLFLDEVGEIPLELQAKLLRLLSDGEIVRFGESTPRKLDVRVVATTNRDLSKEVELGRFRSDLFHRLRAFPILVPPLRQRKDDVLPLARSFLRRAQSNLGRSDLVLALADERALLAYDWPGNTRELQQLVERAVILSPTAPLRLDLAFGARFGRASSDAPPSAIRTDTELRELERANLRLALEKTEYRVAGAGGAAELLGISPSTLRDRMRAFGIEKKSMERRAR
jgi:transcriptional regulator with GAF, ATPase, and Fis domain